MGSKIRKRATARGVISNAEELTLDAMARVFLETREGRLRKKLAFEFMVRGNVSSEIVDKQLAERVNNAVREMFIELYDRCDKNDLTAIEWLGEIRAEMGRRALILLARGRSSDLKQGLSKDDETVAFEMGMALSIQSLGQPEA